MSVETIVRVIEAEAAEEAERIVAAARERARALVGEAEAAAEARVRQACERAEPGYRAEAMRLVNAARLRLLEARAEEAAGLVEAVFRAAGERLAALAADPASERWRRALERLLEETVRLAGPGAILRVRPVDAAVARPVAARLGGRLDETLDAGLAPGVLARSPDGRLEVEATLPARLARARVALAEPVARRLGVAD